MTAALPPHAAELRRADRERYLLSLFAPAAVRPQVWAIEAFAAEIARIPDLVSEEMLGHIRLAWWREAVQELYEGRVRGHPVVQALAPFVAARRPPPLWFEAMLEARAEQLASPRIDDWEGYARFHLATSGMRSRLCSLARDEGIEASEAASRIGQCYGMLRGFTDLRRELVGGECLLPLALLNEHQVNSQDLLNGKQSGEWQSLCKNIRGRLQKHFDSLPQHFFSPQQKIEYQLVKWKLAHLTWRFDPLSEQYSSTIRFLPLRLLGTAILTQS